MSLQTNEYFENDIDCLNEIDIHSYFDRAGKMFFYLSNDYTLKAIPLADFLEDKSTWLDTAKTYEDFSAIENGVTNHIFKI